MLASDHPLRRFWRPETGIFLLLWLYLLLAGQSRLLRDPGTLWHTVVGEKMLSSGQLVREDPFSFTFGGKPWIPHQWLAEILMALLHRFDGLDTLLLATATILAATYTWLAHRLIRAGLHWSLTGLVVVLVVAASASHMHARPHIATIAFLGITYAWLIDYEAGRIGMRRLLWLVPLYIFWTSIHGGLLGGLGTMIAALGGWCVWLMLGWESPLRSWKEVAVLAWLIVVCGLTVFVNPYGAQLPGIWLNIMNQPLLPDIIQEHARMSVLKLDGITVVLVAAVYLAALANLRRWPRVTWLLPLLWLVQACSRIRHGPLFAITAGLALAEIIPQTRWAARRLAEGSDLYVPPLNGDRRWAWRPAVLPVAVVAVALVLQGLRMEVPVIGHGWARLDPAQSPVELDPELRHLQESHPEGRIFNDLSFGGYLIYTTPKLRIFVDDRCELYRDQWLWKYVQADMNGPTDAMREWESTYPHFDLALVRTDSGFDGYFRASPEWERIKATETATLYRRK